jgi:RHS repeat-associated protein
VIFTRTTDRSRRWDTYDGDGDRVEKSNGKIYWYGAGTQVLDESDGSGNITDEYVYFGGKRVAHRVVSGNSVYYYAEDLLGSSRALATSAGGICFDADFYPYGGEHDYTNTCAQNYKFTGKERDPETNNDDFDARYYSSAYGRFLSADCSSTPSPVPYANLTNPQTLNLYAMVSDNPESFADLDGHFETVQTTPGTCAAGGSQSCEAQNAAAQKAASSAHSASFEEHADALNATTSDKSNGVTTNTKLVGGSVSGTASSDPSKVSGKVEANAEVHTVKTELSFTSNPNGGPGLAEGKVNVNFGTADAGAHIGTDGAGAKAEASVLSFSGTVKLGSITMTGTVNAVGAGAQASLTSRGASLGATFLVGADVSIQWGSRTIASKSAETP